LEKYARNDELSIPLEKVQQRTAVPMDPAECAVRKTRQEAEF
jgi:hypothetical protein